MKSQSKHLVSVYVQDGPGVSIRIALVFARRGYNIESFVGSETNKPGFSLVNIVASGDQEVLHQIINQLNRLVNVLEAREIDPKQTLQRELVLFKVNVDAEQRPEAVMIAQAAGCEIIEVLPEYISLQCVGTSEKIDGVVRIFSDFGIRELMRTGKVFLSR
ncbi:acetolactate synthase small subunit [Spirochaeta lutea]|uniref:acetolactate synthase small subunit n=1 Tax=Spirochaeta lutea TaxID=1480694 RepID=UPI0007A74CBB|nr:acetolactate synthase small subunit [Spirochaeta lutea]